MTRSLPWIWLRRYKWFFAIGLLILVVQLFLANWLPNFGNSDQSHFVVRPHESEASSSLAKATPIAIITPKKTTKKYELRDGDLLSYPGCVINSNDALSAIQRATTPTCKQTIANITCAIQADTFYAASLPNSCPNESFIANRALGCFQDQKKPRLLDGYFTSYKQLNTPGKCIQLCLQSGFLYAGVQYAGECFCGNTEPPSSTKLEDSECNYACLGEPTQMCGGYYKINVYETGISKFIAQTAELVQDREKQDDVKIAFLLTLNGRAVRQVHRLLKSLYSTKHFYYIHVDSRQDYLYRELLKLESHAPNIRLARNRFSTIWGGASLLSMLLASMKDLQSLPWRWDFVINLSESDFPIKTLDKLVEFLSANKDRNFVKSHGREVQHFIQKQGLDKTFVECDTHMWRIGDRTLPAGIQIDGGSDWVALSRPFVEYVVRDDKDELISGLIKLFQHTLLPAESFFHTAIRNSIFCNTYVDNNLHLTNWKRRLGCNCQTKHVVDWCGCSPNDYKPDDWPRILQTEGKQLFFARKFEPIINQAVILKLETWLYGQSYMLDVPNVRSYWQSIYDHRDISPKADQALMLVAERVVHLKLSGGTMDFKINSILSVHIYMENDFHRGMLVHANVTVSGSEIVSVEIWTRPDQLPQASRSLALGKRISHLEVSSDFDKKEKVARNFVQVLGPKSEPTLIMHIREATSKEPTTFNVTILWISPAGLLVDVTELNIEDSINGDSIHSSKSNLKSPILSGIWTAKVIHHKKIISKCEFMILPLTERDVSTLSADVLRSQASGASSGWSQHLTSASDADNLIERALENVSLVGEERLTWIDQMVKRFYVYKDICSVASASGFASECAQTNWSSMAADPKSDIYSDLRVIN